VKLISPQKFNVLRELVIPLLLVLLGSGVFASYNAMTNTQAEIKVTMAFILDDIQQGQAYEPVIFENRQDLAVLGAQQVFLFKRVDILESQEKPAKSF